MTTFGTFRHEDVSYFIFTGSLNYGPFDLLTTNLDKKYSELEIHVNAEKSGIRAKSKTRFLLGNYNEAVLKIWFDHVMVGSRTDKARTNFFSSRNLLELNSLRFPYGIKLLEQKSACKRISSRSACIFKGREEQS